MTEHTERITLRYHAELSGVPTRFRVLPWGKVKTSKGEFVVNEESARLIQQAFADRGVDMVIDWEHSTVGGEFKRPDGKAPAAGWIKAFEPVPGDGIYALSDWTEDGQKDLESKSYRYFSPVVDIRKADRVAFNLHSVALTNKPATKGIQPLVASETFTGDTADETDDTDTFSLELVQSLGLIAGASRQEVLTAIETLKSSQQESETVRLQLQEKECDEAIMGLKKQGKLLTCQEDFARKLFNADRELFSEYARTASVLRPQGRTVPPKDSGNAPAGRSGVIQKATSEFHQGGGERRIGCSLPAFINQALRDGGLPVLDDHEKSEYARLIA